ncbi:oxidoreductase [Ameyamaea chiangmaiensis NBRC 103196]|uniref:SDR family NAD(P)-dependent oxidoreductase n=1 Tax=Ameyamaea chiangmaiensis TaxID=442969 RepID=A0A850PFP7_9PROT|nr:SDR family NAD(P)-dependent oxidoreductase [Ameyamaea chiangmaiensis]MBS4074228.1 SDR family NAD(P)-dependent oxidoreductase [Ameyamaea chiangmaiensis]NVN41270.1 SDR family NAD(P)-dependent oxidoreductase [Ameyamaea chiangmaiensis]GBQ71310.1 oxidoreductase [Ameyamaea chiangmaiensis NBRC 103196]
MRAHTILITGAASGIGRGLAGRLSRHGRSLHLMDRDAAGLAETARACVRHGATVDTRVQDVRDADALRDWIAECGPIDLAFVCAGVTGGIPASDRRESDAQVRTILSINVDGVLNTLLPLLDVMRGQAVFDGVRGRICVMSSVAGLVSYPGTPAYCASKAAVDRFVVASAAMARRDGIVLNSVCCGFVKTPMVAANAFAMPGLCPVETAVTRILRGVARGQRRTVFPWWLVAGSRLLDLLPPRVAEMYYLNQPTGAAGTMPTW